MAKLQCIRFLLIFLLVNLCTNFSYAQFDDDEERTFYGGLVFGTNFSQIDGDNFAGYHHVGINTGVVVYTRLANQFAISMELLYTQKGSRAAQSQVPTRSNDQNFVLTDYKIKLNYAEVPLLLNFYDKKKNNAGGGFSYGQLFSSREIYRDGQGFTYENDAKLFPFRKADINLVLNGSAHIWKGLFINLRYQYSLISIRSAYNYVTGRPQQFNNIWTTRLMYVF